MAALQPIRLRSWCGSLCQNPEGAAETLLTELHPPDVCEACCIVLRCVLTYTGVPAARPWGLLSAAEALLPCAGLPGGLAARLAEAASSADAGADAAVVCSGSVTSQALQTQVGVCDITCSQVALPCTGCGSCIRADFFRR